MFFKGFSMNKLLFFTLSCIVVQGSVYAMEKDKNIISEELCYSRHALEQMEERNISQEEVDHVVRNGIRAWDLEDRGANRYIERKNKANPLIVVLDRNVEPNVVVTAYIDCLTQKKHVRKLPARAEAYLKEQADEKEKDLRRERLKK
jgi:hypothetical protein